MAPSQIDWDNSAGDFPMTMGSSTDKDLRKQLVVAATCSDAELRNLIQTTAEALESVSFSINSQNPSSSTESSQSFEGGSRHIVITAFCLPDELAKLMHMVMDIMWSVSFSVSPSDT